MEPKLQSETTLAGLARECGPHIHTSRRYEPVARAGDRALRTALRRQHLTLTEFPGALLHEPEDIRTTTGGPYRVFTPFWQGCLTRWASESSGRPPLVDHREARDRALDAWQEVRGK